MTATFSFHYTGAAGPVVLGRDFNFYKKVSVSNSTFNNACDAMITFSTESVMFLNEGSGATNVVEYSFNGNTVHGELDPTLLSKQMIFNNRVVSKIWFRLKAGSSGNPNVRIDAWSIR